MYILIVALYSSLGGSFNVEPHEFARFNDLASCIAAQAHIEEQTMPGRKFVAICQEEMNYVHPR